MMPSTAYGAEPLQALVEHDVLASVAGEAVVLGACLVMLVLAKFNVFSKHAKSDMQKISGITRPPPAHPNASEALVKRIVNCLDRAHALDLYQKHNAQIDWSKVSEGSATKAFQGLCLGASMKGRSEMLDTLLLDMSRLGIPRTSELYTSLLKVILSQRCFKEALALAPWITKDCPDDLDRTGWSCLMLSAFELQDYGMTLDFFRKVQGSGEPTTKDFKCAVHAHLALNDLSGAAGVITRMHEEQLGPDVGILNAVFTACCASSQHLHLAEKLLTVYVADVVAYNTLIKGYASAGRLSDAFGLLESMKSCGVTPTAVTFGTLMDACIDSGLMDEALKVFQQVISSNVEMNAVLFTTLIKGFVKAGRVKEALEIFSTMLEQGVEPDVVTFSTLIVALCDQGDLEGAIVLFGKCKHVDQVVFNNLLNGCALCKNFSLGEKLLQDMSRAGIQPTANTATVVLKLYASCKGVQETLVYFENMKSLLGIAPDQWAYYQLVLICLRARKCSIAVEKVKDMIDAFGVPPDTMISKIVMLCVRTNLFEAAVQIVAILLDSGAQPKLVDLPLLEEVTRKKKKLSLHATILQMSKKFQISIQGCE